MENKPHPLVKLAKETIAEFVITNTIIDPPAWLDEKYLKTRAGAFVTIKKYGELRGCVGTYYATKNNIALEIISNAIAAASEDPRFDPIAKNELNDISFDIYILEEPEQISGINQLDPKNFGVLVFGDDSKRSGLLLPGLEGIDTAEQQLAIVCQKAGIDQKKEKITMFRFKTEKYE